jgi:hypothetical protein
MPRKKPAAPEAAQDKANAAGAAVAESENKDAPPMTIPAYIDGPPVTEDGKVITQENPQAKNWGPPYKAIYTSSLKGFEMGEDRRFKQRVFKFVDKPEPGLLQALKDAGFTYRANEKSWTIAANPETRALSDDLALRFGGEAGVSRG